MKILGIIIVVLLVIIAAVVTFAMTLPAEFRAQANELVSAPPESLYVRFATPRTWARWSAWTTQSDPTIAYTYTGPDSGVGATMHWISRKLGSGQLQIVETVPARLVHYEVRFLGSPAPIVGRVRLEPAAGGTAVAWSDEGKLGGNLVMRLMVPLMRTMMRKAYAQSFANLRAETHDGVMAQPKP